MENLTAADRYERLIDQETERIRTEAQTYSEAETAQIDETRDALRDLAIPFQPMKSPDWQVTMMRAPVKGNSHGVLRGSAVVDASVERCAAYNVTKVASGRNAATSAVRINSHSFVCKTTVDVNVAGVNLREFVWISAWRWEAEGEELLVTYKPYVRGTSTILVRMQKLPPVDNGRVPQTRVTYTQRAASGSLVPKKLANRFGVAQLQPLVDMKVGLDQSEKIDGDKRLEFEEMVRAHDQPYTEEELEVIKKGQDLHEIFEGGKGKVVKLPSSLATTKVARKEGDNHAFGWATTTVRAR
ncbi:hypothetical protein TeGR_g6800 [Tetraparma gracilis]|uniref:Uncharacterized protein n=1 Tax=Tetraparma gracilis TaxID=2962635 RepID=A0ABQ6M734_9STRA|nr:hypothetical protein TeGR_g6800 [Tetraparma gracilis]